MATDLRVAAIFSLMASACTTGLQYGDEAPSYTCGTNTEGWIISEAPADADIYRRLAAENPNFRTSKISIEEWGHHDQETWLTKPSGEVILCLAEGPPWEAWGTSFWKFSAPGAASGNIEICS